MNIKKFFERLTNYLDLGEILDGPTKVTGGFMHQMFRVFTDKGQYIVKLLNPNVMKRSTAKDNFDRADLYEEVFKENNIPAVYSLIFNGQKRQEIDGQYFYVYEWYDGKTLKDGEITKYHCEKMGQLLAKIHNINLINQKYIGHKKNIDFKYYIDLAKEKVSPIYDLIYDKLDILNDSMIKGNEVLEYLPNYSALCHNDMDYKNVMWKDNDYKLIDLECLDYSNPYLELYELALCWSGYETCNINFDLFKTFFRAYFDNTKLDTNIDWEKIYYANNGRLEWLEYNIKRSLLIECNNKEEQEMGINEVKETIEHVIYYDKVKDDILNNIQELLK